MLQRYPECPRCGTVHRGAPVLVAPSTVAEAEWCTVILHQHGRCPVDRYAFCVAADGTVATHPLPGHIRLEDWGRDAA